MAETGVKRHVRERGPGYLKLAAAVGALTAAINGYVEIQRNQEILLQTLAARINHLTAKVAYLEGRMEGWPRKVAPTARETERPTEGAVRRKKLDEYQKLPSTFKELRRAFKAQRQEE